MFTLFENVVGTPDLIPSFSMGVNVVGGINTTLMVFLVFFFFSFCIYSKKIFARTLFMVLVDVK